jgi:hypothetical protein
MITTGLLLGLHVPASGRRLPASGRRLMRTLLAMLGTEWWEYEEEMPVPAEDGHLVPLTEWWEYTNEKR